MSEYTGINQRFTVIRWNTNTMKHEVIDYYLKVAFVHEHYHNDFPHLELGDICWVDLTVSNKHDDDNKDPEVMIQMAKEYIKHGSTIEPAINTLRYQKHNPVQVEMNGETHAYGSVHDFIGEYLDGLRVRDEPI